MPTAIVEPQTINTKLNVDFKLPKLLMEPDVEGQTPWVFEFSLHQLSDAKGEDFMLSVHFAEHGSAIERIYTAPYVLWVTVRDRPHDGEIYGDLELQHALLYTVKAEIDMRLRQHHYRQAEPRITHAVFRNILGTELARTRHAHFNQR